MIDRIRPHQPEDHDDDESDTSEADPVSVAKLFAIMGWANEVIDADPDRFTPEEINKIAGILWDTE